jgi:hypothetical protein
MNTSRLEGKNCCLRECSYPLRSLLCVGAKVMLLVNYIVKYKLMNGSVEVVKQLCFSNPEGDKKGTEDSRMYVVVDFPESTIPEHQKLIPNQPKTWIPIPLFTQRCDKKCCSITAIPLMICKSLSIHKSQGMTVGHGKQFTKLVVHLQVGVGGNKCPGLELVAVSRAVELNDFAVGNSITEPTKQALLRIGNTDAYCAQKMFLEETRRKSIPSQEQTIVAITQLDTTTTSGKTFVGGCKFLLEWFRSTFPR